MDEKITKTVPPAENDPQPESPGQIISAFLLARSATFRDLAALRQEVCELGGETHRKTHFFFRRENEQKRRLTAFDVGMEQ